MFYNKPKPFISVNGRHLALIRVGPGKALIASGTIRRQVFDDLVVIRFINTTGVGILFHNPVTNKDETIDLEPINVANSFIHTRGRDTCLTFEFP